ncbi:MAG: glycerophosphodiester phosphodiesterase [Microbacterium sp.]
MPPAAASDRARDRTHALLVVCVLAVASVVIAFLGASPARVSATELMGDPRTPGDAAFIASHRGGGAAAPENTLPAISAALQGGFGYVEVDVALTADGHAVLMHDRRVDRTTDGAGPIGELTLAEVRALDAGSWFDPAYAGTQVPTLAEFLDLLADLGGRAIVELKGTWDQDAVAGAVAEISARSLERSVALASFDARTLALCAAESEVVSRLLILKHLPRTS